MNEKALKYLYGLLKDTRIALGNAERKPNVDPAELDNLRAKIDMLEYSTAAVLAYEEPKRGEWIDDGSLLYQVVEISGVTANSKVDPQPTAYQILDLQNNDIAFVLENNDGVVTAYCLGGRPNKSYTMQVLNLIKP